MELKNIVDCYGGSEVGYFISNFNCQENFEVYYSLQFSLE